MKKIIYTSIFFLIPFFTFAQEVVIEVSQIQNNQQQLEISLFVNSDVSLNAFEGNLKLKDGYISSLKEGGSIVSFWVKKPQITDKELSFSGVVPFGFIGQRGKLFSFVLDKGLQGDLRNAEMIFKGFKNDGFGTEVDMKYSFKETESSLLENTNQKFDNIPPASFVPLVSKSEDVFENKYFVAFETNDKQTGISHYKIKEVRYRFLSFFFDFSDAQSPVLLKDQNLQSFIFIKAVDQSGNEVVEEIKPAHVKWQEIFIIFLIIIYYIISSKKRKK